jgi:DNA-binding transcriptional MerR regulator
MTAAELETRPLYGIGTVARLTRVRPETLRIWERRYGLGASKKARNGRRLYTQTELEHLQIVVRLVEQGFRIGEIASMERKTLEAMIEQGGSSAGAQPAELKPRVWFIGASLSSWLDQHPGCLSGLDSRLLRAGLDGVSPDIIEQVGQVDLLVVECGAVSAEQVEQITELRRQLGAHAALVFYQFSHQRWLSRLAMDGVAHAQLPLDTSMFAAQIKRLKHSLEVDRGVSDAGELAVPRSRIFKDAELAGLKRVESSLACGCTHHLADIIQVLNHFEQYSSQCAVESWSDAATHTCVYAYTNQARWLMEKALQAVMEEHADHAAQG